MFKLSKFFSLSFVVLLIFSLVSCEKDDPIVLEDGSLKVQVEFVFGANQVPWDIDLKLWHPKTGDSLTFTSFQFYMSNVRLKKSDGTWWSQPDSYFLICPNCADKTSFMIDKIPPGEYTDMEYMLGVDSARNMAGAQTGDLNPSNGMFWNFTDGYIMIKAEGISPNSSTGQFSLHLGGFSGPDKVVMKKTTNFFGQSVLIEAAKKPVIYFTANPARLWHSAPGVSVNHTVQTPGPLAREMGIAFFDNFAPGRVEQ